MEASNTIEVAAFRADMKSWADLVTSQVEQAGQAKAYAGKPRKEAAPANRGLVDDGVAVEEEKSRTTGKASAVPPDVAALMSSLSLSAYGPGLVEKLGASTVADLEYITLQMLKEDVGMKPLEAARLLNAVAASSASRFPALTQVRCA